MKNIRQKLCLDIRGFYRDTDYGNMEKLVQTEEELRRKISCRDKVMYVATLKEEETLVMIDKQGRDM